MTEPVHWFAAFGLICLVASGFILNWATAKLQEATNETRITVKKLDVLLEALALIHYGAHQEAMDLLTESLDSNKDRG